MTHESFLIVIGVLYREMYRTTNDIYYLIQYAEISGKLREKGIDLTLIKI